MHKSSKAWPGAFRDFAADSGCIKQHKKTILTQRYLTKVVGEAHEASHHYYFSRIKLKSVEMPLPSLAGRGNTVFTRTHQAVTFRDNTRHVAREE
jgi:hypothetical protein